MDGPMLLIRSALLQTERNRIHNNLFLLNKASYPALEFLTKIIQTEYSKYVILCKTGLTAIYEFSSWMLVCYKIVILMNDGKTRGAFVRHIIDIVLGMCGKNIHNSTMETSIIDATNGIVQEEFRKIRSAVKPSKPLTMRLKEESNQLNSSPNTPLEKVLGYNSDPIAVVKKITFDCRTFSRKTTGRIATALLFKDGRRQVYRFTNYYPITLENSIILLWQRVGEHMPITVSTPRKKRFFFGIIKSVEENRYLFETPSIEKRYCERPHPPPRPRSDPHKTHIF